jgi:hypothetical protein
MELIDRDEMLLAVAAGVVIVTGMLMFNGLFSILFRNRDYLRRKTILPIENRRDPSINLDEVQHGKSP